MYRVDVDWAPAHELLVSLQAYATRSERKTLELGADWFKYVQAQMRPELAAELKALASLKILHVLDLLVRLCPGERDAPGFLRWLEHLPSDELYRLLAPYADADTVALNHKVVEAQDRYVALLSAWHEQYFRHVDPAILQGLANSAVAVRALAATAPPLDVVEQATNGVLFQPRPEPAVVLLVPHYHYRPWNLFSTYHELRLILYPVDALPPAPGEPPSSLLRLTRALDDENRLRILHYLAAGPRSFTDMVGFTGLAKSTVHHHMVALRSSGLIRVHDGADGVTYSLRPGAVDELRTQLGGFLALR